MVWLMACAADRTAVSLGTLTADDESADALYAAAYGYDADTSGGHGVVLVIVPKPSASCRAVGSALVDGGGFRELVDPGTCTLTLAASAAYDPAGTSASSAWGDPDTTFTASAWCAMGDAGWNDDGTYAGDVWEGTAGTFEIAVSGGAGGNFTWSLDSNAWDGGFPYDPERDTVEADGPLAGGGAATWCEDFAGTVLLN